MTGRVGASSIPQQAGRPENLRWTVPNIPSSSLERTRTAGGHPRTVPIGASTFWPEAFRHRHRAMGTAIWLAFSHHTVEYPTQRESETRACNFEAMPSSAVWPEPPTAASLRQTDSPMRKWTVRSSRSLAPKAISSPDTTTWTRFPMEHRSYLINKKIKTMHTQ